MLPFYKAKVDVADISRKIYKTAEAALPMNQSHDALRGHLRTALMSAHGVSNTYDSSGPWVSDVFPQHVVYSHGGQNYKRKYTVTQGAAGSDPTVTVGDAKKVHVAYVSSASEKESMRVLMDAPDSSLEENEGWYKALGGQESVIITLDDGSKVVRESVEFCWPVTETGEAQAKGGFRVYEAGKTTIPVCIIKPGWGSCAYYSKEMIMNTGPKAFKKGTQMFINHATEAEEADRPEGDLNSLASVLNGDAYWNENGPKGPALYGDALLFSDHSEQIKEKGPYIGVSINAAIKANEGSVGGRTGLIAESFTRAYSVDYVTKAGAGGAPIVPVTESQRGSAPTTVVKENTTMAALTDQEIQTLRDSLAASEARNRVYESTQNRILGMAAVGAIVREAGFTIKPSLLERVCESPKMVDGKVDLVWAKAVADDLVDVGESAGAVTGMGEGHLGVHEGGRNKVKEAEEDKRFEDDLKALGVSEAGLKYATGQY